MSKVYVVLEKWVATGATVDSIHSTPEAAEEARDECEIMNELHDMFIEATVEEHEVFE